MNTFISAFSIIIFILSLYAKKINAQTNGVSNNNVGENKNSTYGILEKVKSFIVSRTGFLIIISLGIVIIIILIISIIYTIKKARNEKDNSNPYVEASKQNFYDKESSIKILSEEEGKSSNENVSSVNLQNGNNQNRNNLAFNASIIEQAHTKETKPMNNIRTNEDFDYNNALLSDYNNFDSSVLLYNKNSNGINNSIMNTNINNINNGNGNKSKNSSQFFNTNFNENSFNQNHFSFINSSNGNNGYNQFNNNNNSFINSNYNTNINNNNLGVNKFGMNQNNNQYYEAEDDELNNNYSVSPYEKLINKKPEPVNVFDRETNPNRTSSLIGEDDIKRLNKNIENSNEEIDDHNDEHDSLIQSYYNNYEDENKKTTNLNSSIPGVANINNNNSNIDYNNNNRFNNNKEINDGRMENNIPPEFRRLRTYRVIHNFKPHRFDELAVKKGHLLKIIKSFEDGWALCYNINTRNKGFIPRNKLRIIDEQQSSEPIQRYDFNNSNNKINIEQNINNSNINNNSINNNSNNNNNVKLIDIDDEDNNTNTNTDFNSNAYKNFNYYNNNINNNNNTNANTINAIDNNVNNNTINNNYNYNINNINNNINNNNSKNDNNIDLNNGNNPLKKYDLVIKKDNEKQDDNKINDDDDDDVKVIPNFGKGQIILQLKDNEDKKKIGHQIIIEDNMLSHNNSCHVVLGYADTSSSNLNSNSSQLPSSNNNNLSPDSCLKMKKSFVPSKSKLSMNIENDDDDYDNDNNNENKNEVINTNENRKERYEKREDEIKNEFKIENSEEEISYSIDNSLGSQESVQHLSLQRQLLYSQYGNPSTKKHQRKRSSSQPIRPGEIDEINTRPTPRPFESRPQPSMNMNRSVEENGLRSQPPMNMNGPIEENGSRPQSPLNMNMNRPVDQKNLIQPQMRRTRPRSRSQGGLVNGYAETVEENDSRLVSPMRKTRPRSRSQGSLLNNYNDSNENNGSRVPPQMNNNRPIEENNQRPPQMRKTRPRSRSQGSLLNNYNESRLRNNRISKNRNSLNIEQFYANEDRNDRDNRNEYDSDQLRRNKYPNVNPEPYVDEEDKRYPEDTRDEYDNPNNNFNYHSEPRRKSRDMNGDHYDYILNNIYATESRTKNVNHERNNYRDIVSPQVQNYDYYDRDDIRDGPRININTNTNTNTNTTTNSNTNNNYRNEPTNGTNGTNGHKFDPKIRFNTREKNTTKNNLRTPLKITNYRADFSENYLRTGNVSLRNNPRGGNLRSPMSAKSFENNPFMNFGADSVMNKDKELKSPNSSRGGVRVPNQY